MNAIQANAISLPAFLKRLGTLPQKQRLRDCLYLSPLRGESTPSFHVNVADNIWFDFGQERGGDVVDLACAILESRGLKHGVQEGLAFLSDLHALSLPPLDVREDVEEERSALEVVSTARFFQHEGLIRYLTENRKIPIDLAEKYLIEVKVQNRKTGSVFSAVGMRNTDGGYELRNGAFKGCAGRKDVTVIRGARFPARDVHVFEGMMDMLSALADQDLEAFPGDVIVLHSLACLSKALPYIEDYESYRRVFSWLDNDRAGEKASLFLQRIAEGQGHLSFCRMNSTYAPFKDVNESRVRRLMLYPSA